MYFLMYHMRFSAMCVKDLAHRLRYDVLMSVGDAGMKQSMLLMTVVLNADHGPWSEERWPQEARDGVVAY